VSATVKGMYIPFYQFEATYTSAYRAKVGYNQKSAQTTWKFVYGKADSPVSALVCASTSRRECLLLKKFKSWRTTKLHLVGVEELTSDSFEEPSLEQSFIHCKETSHPIKRSHQNWWDVWKEYCEQDTLYKQEQEVRIKALKNDHKADVVSDVYVEITVHDLRHCLVYLPAYLAFYNFNNQDYLVAVNGQNGYLFGERPYLGQSCLDLVKKLVM